MMRKYTYNKSLVVEDQQQRLGTDSSVQYIGIQNDYQRIEDQENDYKEAKKKNILSKQKKLKKMHRSKQSITSSKTNIQRELSHNDSKNQISCSPTHEAENSSEAGDSIEHDGHDRLHTSD